MMNTPLDSLYQTKIFNLYGQKTEKNPPVQKAVNEKMSEVHAQAINLYSRDAYRLLNAHYRKQQKIFSIEAVNVQNQLIKYGVGSNEKKLKQEAAMITKLVKEGLDSLEDFSGQLYRGDILAKREYMMMKTGEYEDKAVMSFSKNKGESETFAIRLPMNEFEKYPVFITLNTHKGKNISDLTKIKNEEEVVMSPGSKFKVDKMEKGIIKSAIGRVHQVTFIVLSDMS